ncbi:bifunctional adenosylcobinamide kinase/adenosylcobinamide-phosphate guanylyltransferase [Salipaludibacillus agaradhaerens]|uniref:Bifunctional adenosylcobinamide kinase/adenosylcobinamide-phosphate guanylyltransferase n=1 Tax=Salipaludibacillus agaradhaerens TaxID=76935 RepID=A0A9Q4FY90_SALAG|nr:bifunctional adenosylcobinamide kinase/adenosylcobinamide-phosphate guanylyltransferase [Salipaludibacillus agaradhaerens]MCR6097410.1 bifunctional adenosylcobinamide kinase/adenosylcobinamide-phosphate guanylyltransferase [Salipaludibacillus agaradhaerens]MCR6105771.1 bifunctional adenosylcobinamide kinase/adenosylcobinamide-phosphate guanylyltransferase [Salipaludibacillus agaradhaerens]MCR6113106.1 bifunctional adenosylcobinamide kinase/adenosylcobinamide-phosphate guanylyltransferase [Sal
MQLIIGGTYSGKRQAVRKLYPSKKISWVSAYEGIQLGHWQNMWEEKTLLVLEGWEVWLRDEIEGGRCQLDVIREGYRHTLEAVCSEEKHRNEHAVVIMLEMGRGIVPIAEADRSLRDICGWLQQDAATLAADVTYVWHGLEKKIK